MNQKPRILLVDDDVDTREMYAWSLEARGFDVVVGANATQAAALASERPPDVLVTDFTLPGEDGFVLASRIRDIPMLAEMPMVLVSGRAFVGRSGERAMELFDRVLLKPVLPDQLVAEIVPLLADRAAGTLQRLLRDVRQRIAPAPRASALGQVLAAVTDMSGAGSPAAFLADNAAQYIAVNDAACRLTERSREELLSLRVWDLTPDAALAEWRRQWAHFVKAGALAGAFQLRTASGLPVDAWFAASAHIVPGCHLSLLRPIPAALSGETLQGLAHP